MQSAEQDNVTAGISGAGFVCRQEDEENFPCGSEVTAAVLFNENPDWPPGSRGVLEE